MRAQTTLDFAIGISIFIAVVLFTFGFVPTLLDPFDAGAEERPIQAERAADSLSQGMLGSPEEPHVLDRFCTVDFFDTLDNDDSGHDDCRYSADSLGDRLGFSFGTNANVTVRQGDDLLCWSDDGSEFDPNDGPEPGVTTECDSSDSSDDVMFAAGEEPRSDLDTTLSAQRIVTVSGERATLEVVVW